MNSFWLDFRRQFNRRACSTASLRREWGELARKLWAREPFLSAPIHRALPETWRLLLLFSLPVLVAVLVMLAFMTSSPPKDDKFIFFSTLYAFWLGLFGSCQTLNGEVASGEWSYWVLGNRLRFRTHLLAVTFVSFAIPCLQVGFFTVTTLALDRLVMQGTLVAVFAQSGFQLCFPDSQGATGMLTPEGQWWLAVFVFVTALLAASTSGVCLGTLLSASFKEQASSVRAAVAVIVVQAVISATVLERDLRFPLLTIWWDATQRSAFFDDIRQNEPNLPILGRHKGEALLEDLSLLTPQRYFYNIGRVLNSNVSGVDRAGGERKFPLDLAFARNERLWPEIKKWADTTPEGRLTPENKEFRHFFRFLLARLMFPEFAALLLLNTIYLTTAYRKIQKGERFHVLR